VQDRAKNLERIARELEVTLFNITHEGTDVIDELMHGLKAGLKDPAAIN
jgi:hypothetical protein